MESITKDVVRGRRATLINYTLLSWFADTSVCKQLHLQTKTFWKILFTNWYIHYGKQYGDGFTLFEIELSRDSTLFLSIFLNVVRSVSWPAFSFPLLLSLCVFLTLFTMGIILSYLSVHWWTHRRNKFFKYITSTSYIYVYLRKYSVIHINVHRDQLLNDRSFWLLCKWKTILKFLFSPNTTQEMEYTKS